MDSLIYICLCSRRTEAYRKRLHYLGKSPTAFEAGLGPSAARVRRARPRIGSKLGKPRLELAALRSSRRLERTPGPFCTALFFGRGRCHIPGVSF